MKKFIIIFFTLFFIGCGVETSNNDSKITGTAVDGYIINAKVIVDVNNNNYFGDKEDYNTTTDANGHFIIPSKYSKYAIKIVGGIDSATGNTITSLFIPKNSEKLNITPLTTLLYKIKDKEKLATILNINAKNIYNDPMLDNSGEITKAVLKLNSAKILSNSDYINIANTLINNPNYTLKDAIIQIAKNNNIDIDPNSIQQIIDNINNLSINEDYKEKETLEKTIEILAQITKETNVSTNIDTIKKIITYLDNNLSNHPQAEIELVKKIMVNKIHNKDENRTYEAIKTEIETKHYIQLLNKKLKETNGSETIITKKVIDTIAPIFNGFAVGFGGSQAFKFHNNVWMDVYDLINSNFSNYRDKITDFNLTAFNNVSNYIKNSKFIDIWITKGWQESWYNLSSLQKLINEGKIPVFIYFYFGDHLNSDYLKDNKENYLDDVKRVSNFFGELNGTTIFIFEPEFNKESIIKNPDEFIDTISKAIDILKLKMPDSLISLCMTDTGSRNVNSNKECGYENCALGDKDEWQKPLYIFKSLSNKLDFISFQEMIAQFSRDPSNPGTWDSPNPISYNDDEIGINYFGKRVDNLALFLKNNLNKPVFLAYVMLASGSWNDENDDGIIQDSEVNKTGWINEVHTGYSQLMNNTNNLFGFTVMNLFDDPNHDEGGYQFFMQNEYNFGIITSDIQDKQLTGNIKEKDNLLEVIFKEEN